MLLDHLIHRVDGADRQESGREAGEGGARQVQQQRDEGGEARGSWVKCEDVFRRCSWGSKWGIKIFTSFRQVTGANIGQVSYFNEEEKTISFLLSVYCCILSTVYCQLYTDIFCNFFCQPPLVVRLQLSVAFCCLSHISCKPFADESDIKGLLTYLV